LQRLIGLYKFERLQAANRSLSDLLLNIVPELPAQTIVVPVPTVSSHIRERGYDHMLLIARRFAVSRHLRLAKALGRTTDTKQRQASARQRIAQAKAAFEVTEDIVTGVPYLLIDDVMTTGATIKYAVQALKRAGATQVWVAVIARQPLD
jgi:ComF family protein